MIRAAETALPPSRIVLALILAVAGPAAAQDSRDDQLSARRAEKAANLRPYRPEGLERRFEMLDNLLVAPDRPVYAFVGKAFEGGGFAVGPGFRTRFGGTGAFDAHAAVSIKNNRALEASLRLPRFADDRVTVALRAHWLDAPDVAFYGIGQSSLDTNRVGLDYRATTIGVSTRVEATKHFTTGGGFDSIAMDMTAADNGSILSATPTYGRTHLFAEFDSRTAARYTREGRFANVQWSDYRQMNGSAYTFGRLDAEFQQFVPLLRENWVIAMRALASTTTAADGREIPYVLLPDLGGSRTLRGYSAWRFRDRNRLLLTGEYRWMAGPLVDMALFLDAGKVTAHSRDIDLRNLTATYGIGASFHTPTSTIVRIELARTPDGSSLLMSFGPSF